MSRPRGLHDNPPVAVPLMEKHGSYGFILNLVIMVLMVLMIVFSPKQSIQIKKKKNQTPLIL